MTSASALYDHDLLPVVYNFSFQEKVKSIEWNLELNFFSIVQKTKSKKSQIKLAYWLLATISDLTILPCTN